MQQSNEWSRQAERILANRHRPHFAPAREVLEIYQSHLEVVRGEFGKPTVLILGATPELADLALSYECRVYRVDSNQAMFAAARERQQFSDRSNETVVCSDWLDMGVIAGGTVDLVMGDAAVNQIPHTRMKELFGELRRITHPGSMLSLKQIVMPDAKVSAFQFDNTVRAYRAGRITSTEFYKILRFYCFLGEAYDPRTRVLNAEKVFATIKTRYEAGVLSPDEFEFLYARRGKLRHSVYTKTGQCKLFQDHLGDCRRVYPTHSFVYENIYNMFLITVAAGE